MEVSTGGVVVGEKVEQEAATQDIQSEPETPMVETRSSCAMHLSQSSNQPKFETER